tara:strand:- start:7394 stop:8095 length:702 start_codon:yes stop_codon:yes gene_type:complete
MSKTKKILFLSHHNENDLGYFQSYFKKNNFKIEIIYPLSDSNLPSNFNNYEGVIILGGAMCVSETNKYPKILNEIIWIKNLIKIKFPIVGICLGAQLIAKASGAEVDYNKDAIVEVGYKDLIINYEDPVIKGIPNKVFEWHTQGCTLPKNAKLLASNPTFETQAFMIGNNIFGFQFHPEILEDMIVSWGSKSPEILLKKGASPINDQLKEHTKYSKDIQKWLEFFLDRWIELR